MLHTGNTYEVESYKDYRNRTMSKFHNRFAKLLSGIDSCSLTAGDKNTLKKEIINKLLSQNLIDK